jgi:hypothetical protein
MGKEALTYGGIGLVLALALVGLGWAVRRRDSSMVALAAAGGVALTYIAARYGPWIQFKAQSVTGPIVLVLAFSGAYALIRNGFRLVGGVAAAAVAAAVLYGNALTYHNISLAPYGRLHDLADIGAAGPPSIPTLRSTPSTSCAVCGPHRW